MEDAIKQSMKKAEKVETREIKADTAAIEEGAKAGGGKQAGLAVDLKIARRRLRQPNPAPFSARNSPPLPPRQRNSRSFHPLRDHGSSGGAHWSPPCSS
jgi:hypothetical protein